MYFLNLTDIFKTSSCKFCRIFCLKMAFGGPLYGGSVKKIHWPSYNKSLVNRGNTTLWIDPKSIFSWKGNPTGRQGAQPIYSDMAIKALSVLRFRFSLPLRSTEGFARSIFKLMGLSIKIPDYSTLSRRFKILPVPHKKLAGRKGGLHIVIDSTGLKVFREQDWKVRQHGSKRTWKKIHLAVDESNSRIEAVALSRHT